MKLKLLIGLAMVSVCAGPVAAMPSGTHSATAKAAAVESKTPGLAIGQKAPNFNLIDQHGKKQSLDGLLKAGPVALVFYRSADW